MARYSAARGTASPAGRWRSGSRSSGVFLGAVPASAAASWTGCLTRSASSGRKTRRSSAKVPWTECCSASPRRIRRRAGRPFRLWPSASPGAAAWAFVILAMLSYGIAPGPRMLEDHADITIMIIVSLGLGNLMVTLLGLGFTRADGAPHAHPVSGARVPHHPHITPGGVPGHAGRERHRHRARWRRAGHVDEAVPLAASTAAHRLHLLAPSSNRTSRIRSHGTTGWARSRVRSS